MKRIFLILVFILGLAAVSSAKDVTFAWDANAETDLIGYRMYYSETGVKPYDQSSDAGNVTEHTITGLEIGKTYYFAVTAYDLENESGYSNILKYTVPPDRLVIEVPSRPKRFIIEFE